MAFPVLLLAFAIPIPGVLINQIVFPMQLWSAELVAQVLNIAGISVVQEGDMLHLADRSFEIIETCSGLRAIVVLAMLAIGLVCYFPARRLHLGSVRFRKQRYRRYRRDDETVSVFVGCEDRLSRSRSLLSPKSAFPGRGWEAEEHGLVELGPDVFPGVRVAARSRASRLLSYHWYQGIEGFGTEVLRAWLAVDRSFLRRPTGALVIRLSTEVSSTGEGRSRAEARLRELAELLLVSFSDFGDGAGIG